MGKDVTLSLKLSGHADFKKAIAVKETEMKVEAPLRKVSSSSSGKGSGSGKGKGSGSKTCDTCLERPD
jgi:hypothetical protein